MSGQAPISSLETLSLSQPKSKDSVLPPSRASSASLGALAAAEAKLVDALEARMDQRITRLEELIGTLVVARSETPKRSASPEPKPRRDDLVQLLAAAVGHAGVKVKAPDSPDADSDFEADDNGVLVEVADRESKDDDLVHQIERNVRLFGSFKAHCRTVEWKSVRNKHECEALAQILDQLATLDPVIAKVPAIYKAKDLAMRRYAGVQMADNLGRWEVCSALQGSAADNSLLPRSAMVKTLKDARLFTNLEARGPGAVSASSAAGGPTGRRRSPWSGQRDGNNRGRQNGKPNRTSDPKKGAAAKDNGGGAAKE
jgi:hypothetical protein